MIHWYSYNIIPPNLHPDMYDDPGIRHLLNLSEHAYFISMSLWEKCFTFSKGYMYVHTNSLENCFESWNHDSLLILFENTACVFMSALYLSYSLSAACKNYGSQVKKEADISFRHDLIQSTTY